jgi:signal peptidase I
MKKFIKDWGTVAVFASICILLRLFVYSPVTVHGSSMDPTLGNGQFLFSLKQAKINRFDIVVSTNPESTAQQKEKNVVKRVIGMPGDHITIKDDRLSVNGQIIDESYLEEYLAAFSENQLKSVYAHNEKWQTWAAQADSFTTDLDVTVPEKHYFLIGDNRLISYDSRNYGAVSRELIQGKVAWRVWPLDQFGAVE